MTQDNLLSVSTIAQELNTGKATIKFLLKRFKENIPSELIDGQLLYPTSTIKILFMIQEKLEMGFLPSDIEKELSTQSIQDSNPLPSLESLSNNSDIRLSSDGLSMLKSLFNDIGEQQNRIADAHEKRAQVEERKAVAIEKRAQAEEKKAAAMNNIATALQEMNQLRSSDATSQQIAHQAATVIITDENNEPYEIDETEKIDDDLSDLISDSDIVDDTDTDLSSLLESNEIPQEDSMEDPLSDDASDFDFDTELEASLDDPLDDLSLLLDDQVEAPDNNTVNDTPPDDTQIDDLSKLIDEPDISEPDVSQIDDLSLLIDTKEEDTSESQLDDLSKLIEPSQNTDSSESASDLDDLSLLIDSDPKETEDIKNTQDDSAPLEAPMDDLSKLIDSSEDKAASKPEKAPIEKDEEPSEETTPEIIIDINPEDDLGKYKAAITKVIIELKASGLTVEEATDRLNKNKVKTLSGKEQWGQKAISQIYKFIDSAK